MLQREVGVSREDLRLLDRNISKLGEYALGLLDPLDLGLDREALQGHLQRTKEQLSTLSPPLRTGRIRLRPKGYKGYALPEAAQLPWNYPQTLRFAAGVCMISENFYPWMKPDNLKRAMAAKVLYQCQIGILDDIVDGGTYGYLEAKQLYHLVLSSMTDPSPNTHALRKSLMAVLKEDQLELFDTIVQIARNSGVLFNAAPLGTELFYEMEMLDERVALGQALTIFQKEPTLDLGQIAAVAKRFYSPDDSLVWYERLANHLSVAARSNLIDLSFADRNLKASKFRSLLDGWYFFDTVITLLNSVVGVYQDLRDGIVNLSLIAMREKEVLPLSSVRGYKPELTQADYEEHLVNLAGIASSGLETIRKGFEDPQQYYPFITLMIGVVMLAEWIGKSDEMIHVFIEALAPGIRRFVDQAPRGGKRKEARKPLLAALRPR